MCIRDSTQGVRLISLEAENEKVVGISRLPEVAGGDDEVPEGGAPPEGSPPPEGGTPPDEGAPPAAPDAPPEA